LIVAAAAGVNLAARVAETLNQSCFDRRMTILEGLVQHEPAATEVVGQRAQLALDACQLGRIQDADQLQALRVRAAGLDVEQEELAVEDHVGTGAEALDALIHLHAGFLPEELGHRGVPGCRGWIAVVGATVGAASAAIRIPASSSRPNARLRFCIAWVAAPLSRLSSVATTTSRRPSPDRVKPPMSTWCSPAIALTHGASLCTRTSGSSA